MLSTKPLVNTIKKVLKATHHQLEDWFSTRIQPLSTNKQWKITSKRETMPLFIQLVPKRVTLSSLMVVKLTTSWLRKIPISSMIKYSTRILPSTLSPKRKLKQRNLTLAVRLASRKRLRQQWLWRPRSQRDHIWRSWKNWEPRLRWSCKKS